MRSSFTHAINCFNREETYSLLIQPFILPITAFDETVMHNLEVNRRSPECSCRFILDYLALSCWRDLNRMNVLNPRSHVRTNTSPNRQIRFLSFALSECRWSRVRSRNDRYISNKGILPLPRLLQKQID